MLLLLLLSIKRIVLVLLINDFRPISLCSNYLYKIIEKIIAIRIEPILENIITSEKFGFLKGRLIHEAIGSTHKGRS